MTKRLFLALTPLALLAACNREAPDEDRAATGEVLEGTVSDAMLPVDRVQSEPPLEDPEAFAEAQEAAADDAAGSGGAATSGDEPAADEGDAEPAAAEEPAAEPAPAADD